MSLLEIIQGARLFDAEGGNSVEGDTLAPPVEGEPIASEPSTETPPVEETPPIAESPKRAPWWQPRIDQLTRRAHEAERAAESERQLRLEAEQRLASGGQTPAPSPRTFTEDEINQRAQAIAAAQTFTERCNNVVAKGKTEFPDFMTSVDTLVKDLGGMSQPFIEAALETPNPQGLIYNLGKNPDVAAEIMGMPPIRQAVALMRYAMELEKGEKVPDEPKTRVTSVPPPIAPKVAGRVKAEPSLDDPELSTEEWMRLREKHLKAARG